MPINQKIRLTNKIKYKKGPFKSSIAKQFNLKGSHLRRFNFLRTFFNLIRFIIYIMINLVKDLKPS
jgi:hypothetical protein